MLSEIEEAKSSGGKGNVNAMSNSSNKLFWRNTTDIQSLKKLQGDPVASMTPLA